MTKQLEFHRAPINSKDLSIHDAALADNRTSVELVSDSESDAFFFRALEERGILLNEAQIEAVRHFHGPALVLAGAGSGKTRVLTSRAGYLITINKIDPKQIMLVTFTKKASEEMKDRISQLPGLSRLQANQITTGTFHSIFFRLLKSRGYNQQVLSNEKRKQLAIKLILKEQGLRDTYEPETLLAILSDNKSKMKGIDELPSKTSIDKEIKDILNRYEQWKSANNFIDFDDMLLETYHLLKNDHQLLQSMQNRFQYILCDEWQDTNPLQFELIRMISKPNDHLFVVGDDDQTIYSFNGADSSIILNFESLYPNTKLITLDINYRSSTSIIGLANQVIQFNQGRKDKILKGTKRTESPPYFLRPSNTDEEALAIIDRIEKEVNTGNYAYRDFVILHRTNSSSRAVFDQLVVQGIPFLTYSKGETFYEQPIVKPVIDYLRISLDPGNIEAIPSLLPSLFLNREKAMYHLEAEQLINPRKQILKHLRTLSGLKDFQRKQLDERINIVKDLKDLRPVQAVKKVRQFYDHYIETDERKGVTLHKEIMIETLSEIEASASKFETVAAFIEFIDEVNEKNQEMETIRRTPNANAVSLMTIHRSKGLEFPVVFLTGASESILPHSSALDANDRKDMVSKNKGSKKIEAAIEEERRLAYVAITRAKEQLYISSPSFYRGEEIEASRFILDPFKPTADQKLNKGAKMTQILVWECTSDTCPCWMRLENKDISKTSRECPMCKGEMLQGKREV
ncbi:UvrD-helicase domain-containing protein [Aquibacillus kalidii]|uniref:UvrD-helicase domain-containing protein n=1 Tax=Aquibacillus kalidii TaxID=2762597 RepID=UPI001644C61D|nr:UvrD-helicase domain-containing protein [Aquibacillus kalidii]